MMSEISINEESLNSFQREAVITTEGYVRVIAGAGSGKTKTLASRYAFLTNDLGISSENILCVTFTNKAANEMKSRIRKLAQSEDCGWVCTFHGFCVKLLRCELHVLNYPRLFMIMDTEDQKDVVHRCFEQLGLSLTHSTVKRTLDDIEFRKRKSPGYISLITAVSDTELTSAYEKSDNNADKLFYLYLIEQRKSYALDFTDLILFALKILNENDEIREKWQKRFQYIMVDEFQDVSGAQFSLAHILSDYHHNLFVVGDPDQAIYSWRGASPTIILEFDKTFPSCKTIYMEQNYRSDGAILSAANQLIRKNSQRLDKNLRPMLPTVVKPVFYYAPDEVIQSKWVVSQIKALINVY